MLFADRSLGVAVSQGSFYSFSPAAPECPIFCRYGDCFLYVILRITLCVSLKLQKEGRLRVLRLRFYFSSFRALDPDITYPIAIRSLPSLPVPPIQQLFTGHYGRPGTGPGAADTRVNKTELIL